MTKLKSIAKKFMREEEGATMVEYAIMVALIAVVCIVAVTAVGTQTNAVFDAVATELQVNVAP